MPHARPARAALWTLSLVAGLLGGCNLSLRKETPVSPDGGVPGVAQLGGVGAPCTADSACRTGLTCAAAAPRTCQPPGNRPAGGACTLSAECAAGLYCSPDGLCAARGTVAAGGKCMLEGECAAGLLCSYQGLSGTCAPVGTGDLGGACTKSTDCLGGLVCSLGKCSTFDSIEPWQGATCPEPATTGAPKVLFKVPRLGDTHQDFYSLPFPNDIRKVGGKISLAGHPTPGARYLPFDPVRDYLTLAEQDLTGFGTNPAVYFRFSRNPRVDTVNATNVNLVNITPGSPEYGQMRELLIEVKTRKSNYVCSPSAVVRPKWGNPLRAGETYAVLLKRGILDEAGLAFDRDDDLGFILGSTAPGLPALAMAWPAYDPLRKWLAETRMESAVVGAAVFTTQKVEEPIRALREAVRAGAAPAIKGLVKCGGGAKSPCEDAKMGADHKRGCFDPAPTASFDEYQGTIAIPVFQAGKKPYETAGDGGGIEFDATGKPMAAASEDVCFTLSVPKGAAPAAGWPVVVYAHGTEGSYRSVIESGLAEELTKGMAPGGTALPPMAVFSYDGALHANRRGGSERSPNELVYNFVNARGARDTSLQAAADLFVIARALEGFTGVALDPARRAVYGHSQGGNAAALAAPYEPGFGAVVLSGTGGTLTLSLLAKKQPVDIAAAVPLLLGDPTVDENHPVLAILQMYFDRSDGVNFGRRLFRDPPMGVPPHNALHVFGTDDTYSPLRTQQTYAQAAGFPVLTATGQVIDDHLPLKVGPPVKGNINNGAATAVQAQFRPPMGDGHFVSTNNPEARRLIQQMLGTFVRDGQPTVGP
jgi:hypothetical protein